MEIPQKRQYSQRSNKKSVNNVNISIETTCQLKKSVPKHSIDIPDKKTKTGAPFLTQVQQNIVPLSPKCNSSTLSNFYEKSIDLVCTIDTKDGSDLQPAQLANVEPIFSPTHTDIHAEEKTPEQIYQTEIELDS
jgi:hypothetical protein